MEFSPTRKVNKTLTQVIIALKSRTFGIEIFRENDYKGGLLCLTILKHG